MSRVLGPSHLISLFNSPTNIICNWHETIWAEDGYLFVKSERRASSHFSNQKRINADISVPFNKLTESSWWFSPLKIDDTGNELLSSADKVHEKSEKLNNASSFSIDMRRFFVNKSYDKNEGLFRRHAPEKLKEIFQIGENTNDLLIVSNFQTGTAPIVSRIHYLKRGQKINQIVGNFSKTLVCSFSDFKDTHITLQTQVYDIDQYDDIKDVVDSASSLAGNISVSFPVVAPYVAM